MTCLISDTLAAVDGTGAIVGLAARPVIARATATPLSVTFDSGTTWHELQGNEIRTMSAEDGTWSLTLFASAEQDPTSNTWQIVLPDGVIWSGAIPTGVAGPLTIKNLKDTYSWTHS